MVPQRRAAAELRGGRRGAVRAGRARAESSFSVVQPLASGSYEHRPPNCQKLPFLAEIFQAGVPGAKKAKLLLP